MSRIVLSCVLGILVVLIAAILAFTLPHRSGRAAPPTAPASPAVDPPLRQEAPLRREPSPAEAGPAGPRPGIGAAVAAFLDAGNPDRLPDDLHARVPTLETPEEIAAVRDLLRDRKESDTARNEAVGMLMRTGVPGLAGEFIALLDDPREEERFRSFLAQYLGQTLAPGGERPPEVAARLMRALADRHLAVRREALLALVCARNPAGVSEARSALGAERWAGAQDLVIHCLHELDARERIPDLRPLCYESDDSVRIAAIAVLGQWRDEASRSAFAEAARSSVVRLRRAGELALASLDAPLNPRPDDPARTAPASR